MKKALAKIEQKVNVLDPLNVNGRLYEACSQLLDELRNDDELSIRDRIAAITAVGRCQVMFMGLRKEGKGGGDAGSAVRKYAAAFTQNASGGGKARTRAAEPDDEPEPFDPFGDDSTESDPAA